jgi:hypothetical protein
VVCGGRRSRSPVPRKPMSSPPPAASSVGIVARHGYRACLRRAQHRAGPVPTDRHAASYTTPRVSTRINFLQGSGGDGEGKVTPVIEASIPAWRVSAQPHLRQFQPDHVRESPRRYRNLLGLGVADFVLVPPGSIPITTSGKARRAVCVERYRQGPFARLDV